MDAAAQWEDWFTAQGWTPFAFQRETWAHHAAGRSGLVQVPTGAGKTYAAYGGPLLDLLTHGGEGLHLLYLTPLRAMTRDLEKALRAPIEALAPQLRVEARTGDTSSRVRARQKKVLPQILMTTPESLSLLLSYPEARERFSALRTVIVDEWHELMVSKRGTQTELALARLRAWNPGLITWALSATVAHPQAAAQRVVGVGGRPVVVDTAPRRQLHLKTLIPANVADLPWAGHLGTHMLPQILEHLDAERSALLFTNTRAQAELWFNALAQALPDRVGQMAVHHGSLDREERERVESGLKDGSIRLVVSTSSLDLGVDFTPVEDVFQVGSPKGIARLLQRGGRAKHQPGVRDSTLHCVPTHTMQLMEFSAAREAVNRLEVEQPWPPRQPLDVLCQHLVTVGMGGGFAREALLSEIRTAVSYADLGEETFGWALDHLTTGGATLRAYPQFHRLVTEDGQHYVGVTAHERQHRASIGTIAADGTVSVRFVNGATIGQIEEYFVARLQKGDTFIFAGRTLEYVRFRAMTIEVRLAKKKHTYVPYYAGGRMPLTSQLASSFRRELARAARGERPSPELEALEPVLRIQQQRSHLPTESELLVEVTETREGQHLFVFPFEGRLVHDGLSALLAYRMTREHPATFTVTASDYGFELLCPEPFPFASFFAEAGTAQALFSPENLLADTLAAIQLGELAKRQFRVIARIAGLVFEGFPSQRKAMRQLQTSSSLIYDVFAKFDPHNRLLQQAQREVLEEQFEQSRLAATLERLRAGNVVLKTTAEPTPLAYPLVADRLTTQLSNEQVTDRIARMQRRGQKG